MLAISDGRVTHDRRLEPLRPRDALATLAAQLLRAPKDFQTGMEALVRLCDRAPAYRLVPAHPAASAPSSWVSSRATIFGAGLT